MEEVLVLFIPLLRVNDTGFETSAEGLKEIICILTDSQLGSDPRGFQLSA